MRKPATDQLVAYRALSKRTTTRPLAGNGRTSAEIEIVVLALEQSGQLVTEGDLERLGVAFAPVEQLAARATLIRRTSGSETASWWVPGPAPETDAEIDAAVSRLPDHPPLTKLRAKPRALPTDKDFFYKSAFGAEPTSCLAFVHPAPESGDFYDVERCFSPAIGMLTNVRFSSVWGSYELELMSVAH